MGVIKLLAKVPAAIIGALLAVIIIAAVFVFFPIGWLMVKLGEFVFGKDFYEKAKDGE